LRWTTVATTVGYAGMGAVLYATPLLADDAGSSDLTGVLLAAMSLGSLIGIAALMRVPVARVSGAVAWGTAGLGAMLGLTAFAPHSLPYAAAALLMCGVFEGIVFGAVLAVRHRETPAGARGRVHTVAASAKLAAFAGLLTLDGRGALLLACAAQGAALVLAGFANADRTGRSTSRLLQTKGPTDADEEGGEPAEAQPPGARTRSTPG
jgi:MFS family permease